MFNDYKTAEDRLGKDDDTGTAFFKGMLVAVPLGILVYILGALLVLSF